jgi:hypothetical protein
MIFPYHHNLLPYSCTLNLYPYYPILVPVPVSSPLLLNLPPLSYPHCCICYLYLSPYAAQKLLPVNISPAAVSATCILSPLLYLLPLSAVSANYMHTVPCCCLCYLLYPLLLYRLPVPSPAAVSATCTLSPAAVSATCILSAAAVPATCTLSPDAVSATCILSPIFCICYLYLFPDAITATCILSSAAMSTNLHRFCPPNALQSPFLCPMVVPSAVPDPCIISP